MTYEEALQLRIKMSDITSSKIYRVCPNPLTDKKGYINYVLDTKTKNLKDSDAKLYTDSNDFDVVECSKEAVPHIKI